MCPFPRTQIARIRYHALITHIPRDASRKSGDLLAACALARERSKLCDAFRRIFRRRYFFYFTQCVGQDTSDPHVGPTDVCDDVHERLVSNDGESAKICFPYLFVQLVGYERRFAVFLNDVVCKTVYLIHHFIIRVAGHRSRVLCTFYRTIIYHHHPLLPCVEYQVAISRWHIGRITLLHLYSLEFFDNFWVCGISKFLLRSEERRV